MGPAGMLQVVQPSETYENAFKRLSDFNLKSWRSTPEEAIKTIQELNGLAWAQGIADSTRSSCRTGWESYEACMQCLKREAYPVTEDKLMLFTGWSSTRITADSMCVLSSV